MKDSSDIRNFNFFIAANKFKINSNQSTMGRNTKKKAEDRITHTGTANCKETKEKKDAQGYGNVTRICSLSQFLNKSFSPIVANKIKEYRLNDALLTNKPDHSVVKDYIETIVEHHSKTDYLAGVRGSLFFPIYTKQSNRPILKKNVMKSGGTYVGKMRGL